MLSKILRCNIVAHFPRETERMKRPKKKKNRRTKKQKKKKKKNKDKERNYYCSKLPRKDLMP